MLKGKASGYHDVAKEAAKALATASTGGLSVLGDLGMGFGNQKRHQTASRHHNVNQWMRLHRLKTNEKVVIQHCKLCGGIVQHLNNGQIRWYPPAKLSNKEKAEIKEMRERHKMQALTRTKVVKCEGWTECVLVCMHRVRIRMNRRLLPITT